MNPFDSITALWVFVALVCCVVAFAFGYLLGLSEGLDLRLRRTLRLVRRRR